MAEDKSEVQQSWCSCFLPNILVRYMEKTMNWKTSIDYPGLFREIEGVEVPSDPESFVKDVTNWVPLSALRELLLQCERISGRKDIAYHAARDYFDPCKKQFPSLFEIIVRVLNDVRSMLIFSDLWASVQTNYLKLQSFETQDAQPELYVLARFDKKAQPKIGSIQFLRGTYEGFPRLYPFVEDAQCIEEISQVEIRDIISDFPGYSVSTEGDRLSIRRNGSEKPVVEAIRIPLKPEIITLSREFREIIPDSVVVPMEDGRITVLTNNEETDPERIAHAFHAYKIVMEGVVSYGTFSCSFKKGQVYNAPYSRFHLVITERSKPDREMPAENVRKEVSHLLFEYLRQIKQTQMRMIQHNIEKRRLTLENIYLRREIEREHSFAGIIGKSEKMRELFGVVRSIAETDVTVHIEGETGTGKELIARAIHYNGPRKAKRFVAVNCGALSETLLESELFGHEKGAFTGAVTQRKGIFEAADGGTLFLDEIGEISPNTQVKLLRVLQECEFQRVGSSDPIRVNIRIVAATNQNLADLVKAGRFRQDLFYRLNVFPIMVPPLRERVEDIPILASHFIEQFNKNMKKNIDEIGPQAMTLLMVYSWPGNVRELENAIQRMMVVSKNKILDIQGLPPEIRGKEEGPKEKAKDLKDIARESSEIAEKRAILDALSKTGENVTKAARLLGISRATLQNKMKAYGLRGPKE
jgi:transcriptional regulator with PAS, ATPase and Fis domain